MSQINATGETGIHPSAQVHPDARIDADVSIGPYCIIGAHVTVGAGTVIENNATLIGRTTLGKANRVCPYAVLGNSPQDLSYKGEDTSLEIGDRNTFREYVTVNTGTMKGTGKTVIGDENLIMAGTHIAHDCVLRNRIVVANNVLFGGHVLVEDDVVFGGMTAVHHFVTVGRLAFVGGMTRLATDAPPYMTVEGNPARVRTVNAIGLKRHDFEDDRVARLKDAYKLIWRSGFPRAEALMMLADMENITPEIQHLMNFLEASEQGRQGRALEAFRKTPLY